MTRSCFRRLGTGAAAVWAALCCAGCRPDVQALAAEVDPAGWEAPVTLHLPNADSTGFRDWQIFLRADRRLAADTFTLQITVRTPDTLQYDEYLPVRLPAAQAPAARLTEATIDYRYRVRLARTGDYRVSIRPLRPLRGITAVGLQTLKSETETHGKR